MKNISIHFTPKGQDLKELIKKAEDIIAILRTCDTDLIIHHAFLTRKQCEDKGFSCEIPDMFDRFRSLGIRIVENECGIYNPTEAREEVYATMKHAPIAFFIGEIKEGLLEEYSMMITSDIECIHIR